MSPTFASATGWGKKKWIEKRDIRHVPVEDIVRYSHEWPDDGMWTVWSTILHFKKLLIHLCMEVHFVMIKLKINVIEWPIRLHVYFYYC